VSELPPDARAVARIVAGGAGLDDAARGLVSPHLAGAGQAEDDPGAPSWAELASAAAGGPDAAPGDDAGVLAERERLSRQLRETRMQLAMTQARLTALQGSATMALGKTIVNAAKRPWPRGAQLPRDLYRMWRDRGAPGKSGGATLATALASAQLADLKGTGGRLLAAQTAPGALSLSDPGLATAGPALGAEPRRLVVTGVLTALACATLAPDAVVHPLLPHDADVVIEGTGADLVVIEAAALLPGSPWAHATDPAAADRGRRLARMIVLARSLGKPVALVRNVAPALLPGLGWVAEACDVVWDGGLGVQLARFSPAGLAAGRPSEPLYAADRDPREAPAVRALLDQLTAPGGGVDDGAPPALRVAGARSWRALPELYRGNAVFVTASPEQAREQAACGARVIGPIGRGTTAQALAAELARARQAGPRSAGEARAGLREAFEAHATPVVLAALARKAALPAALIGGRQLTVLATVGALSQPGTAPGGNPGRTTATGASGAGSAAPEGSAAAGSGADSTAAQDTAAQSAAGAARLAAVLLEQRLRPAEVIVAAPPGHGGPVDGALGPLREAGIAVRVADAGPCPAAGADPAGATQPWASLAALAASPWVAPLDLAAHGADAGLPPLYLLDLACARECAQADAVGFGDADYQYAQRLAAPALARRELFLPGSPAPDAWGARGLRLFTITSETGAP
jgi:hypothetical protein